MISQFGGKQKRMDRPEFILFDKRFYSLSSKEFEGVPLFHQNLDKPWIFVRKEGGHCQVRIRRGEEFRAPQIDSLKVRSFDVVDKEAFRNLSPELNKLYEKLVKLRKSIEQENTGPRSRVGSLKPSIAKKIVPNFTQAESAEVGFFSHLCFAFSSYLF